MNHFKYISQSEEFLFQDLHNVYTPDHILGNPNEDFVDSWMSPR